ncbi:MAG: flagellar motor protein MotB [Methylocystis sp.]|nr:MAG: flagellar motor protein MotB [Methylocystis sp.]
MHQPRKWWIGLPVLAVLVFAAAQSLTPQLEADLKARVAARLAIDPAKVAVSGRDVEVSGAPAEALAALRDEPGVRKFSATLQPNSATSVSPARQAEAPPRAPYVLTMTRGESLIALEGKTPNDELRQKAISLASLAGKGLAVSDAMKIDAAAPSGDYAKALAAALDALGALAQGKVTLADNRLSVEGRGGANVSADGLARDMAKALPPGFEIARIDVAQGPVSPYVFEAAREGGKATLTGYAPDEATHRRVVEAARRRFFDAAVEDRLSVAAGAPQNFIEAVEAALTALARLDEGKVALSDATLSLSGAARYEGAKAEIENALAERLPTSVKSDARLTARTVGSPLDVNACRAALAELAKTPIIFESDDATISESSAPLVDALAATVLRCQPVPVEVAGHIDSQGIEELDRDRSKRRAQAVVDKFVKAGADSFRVWAIGYGATHPLAPNDSDENRARNRRIEFNLK